MKNLTFSSCFDNATFFLEFYRQGLIFFILLIILWFLGFFFPPPASQKNTFQFSNSAYDRIFTNSKVNSFVINRFSFFTQLFITTASFFHFISVSGTQNWWRNSTYLLLQKPESFSLLPSLAVFYVKTSPALLIFLASLITASDFRKTPKFLLYWYFINFLYILSLNIAGNSRYSSLAIFILGVGLLFKKYPTKIIGFLFLIFAPISFIRTYFGRFGTQGFSQIFEYFSVFPAAADFTEFLNITLLSLLNSNYLAAAATNQTYSFSFFQNMVSISPLPGFLIPPGVMKSALLDNLISPVVPYPGFSQIAGSSFFTLMLTLFIYALSLFYPYRRLKYYKFDLISLSSASLSVIGIFLLFQYPLRLSIRLTWLSLFILVIPLLFRNFKKIFFSP